MKYTLTKNFLNLSSLSLIAVYSPIFVPRPILSSTLALILLEKREVKTIDNYLLSPGQTIKTFQHTISQHCEKSTDQHDARVEQRKNLSPQQESNSFPEHH